MKIKLKLLSYLFIIFINLSSFAIGEAILDGTMKDGTSGLTVENFEINSEYGRIHDSNLFHSFSKFNINSDEIASFHSPSYIKNIITRITGNNPTTINGSLNSYIEETSDVSEANLFFLNPSGIVFGPNADINIGGSLYVSTADYLKMEDNEKIYSLAIKGEILSTSEPSAFGFIKENPAAINFNGIDESKLQNKNDQTAGIQIKNGKVLTLVAGEIQIKGMNLLAYEGNINIASVKSPKQSSGEIDISPTNIDWDISGFNESGNISILDNSLIDVSGTGAGNIFIQAHDLELKNGCLIAGVTTEDGNGGNLLFKVKNLNIEASQINTSTYGTGDAANIIIEATESVSFFGEDANASTSLIYARSYYKNENAGKGSDIDIKAKNIFFMSGAGISGTTYGPGVNGSINFIADDLIKISGTSSKGRPSSIITTNKVGSLNSKGGNILFESQSFILEKGARLSLSAQGLSSNGDISIFATDSVLCSGSGTFIQLQTSSNSINAGDSGNLLIDSNNISFIDGSMIYANTYGKGNGGNIMLNANNIISFQVPNESINIGGISIQTRFTNDYAGNSGNLRINAKEILFLNGCLISTITFGSGKGGSVFLNASKSIVFEGENSKMETSRIELQTRGDGEAGDAGNLLIDSPNLVLKDGAYFSSSSSSSGKGGDININAPESVIISGENSNGFRSHINLLTTNKDNVSEETSSLFIESDYISIQNGAYISSDTFGKGKAGSINIISHESLNISGESFDGEPGNIAASVAPESNGGIGGEIKIDTGDLTLNGGGYISTSTYSLGKGGDISIVANGSVLIKGARKQRGLASSITTVSSTKFNPVQNISGDGGKIDIKAGELILEDGGQISVSTLSTKILEDEPTKGDDINVSNKSLDVVEMKSGDAGEVKIVVTGMTELSGINMYGENEDGLGSGLYARSKELGGIAGKAGKIELNTGSLSIKNGAVISSSTTGNSMGGNVDIIVNGALDISGFAYHPELENSKQTQLEYQENFEEYIPKNSYSGIFASSESDSEDSGFGGSVDITGGDMKIFDQARISTSSAGGGDAGDINLRLSSLTIDNQGKISSASLKGAKTIENNSQENKKINGAMETIGVGGAAGTITIETDNYIRLTNKSSLTTEAVHTKIPEITDENQLDKDKNNGKITLNTKNMLYLVDSEITSSVLGGLGNGGDIGIDPDFVIINNSKIIANAYEGNGGNIHIVAGQFVQSASSVVEASSEFGLDGAIEIEAPDVDVSSGLAILPDTFLDATKWINNSCAISSIKKSNSLIIKEKDGASLQFDDWLPGTP